LNGTIQTLVILQKKERSGREQPIMRMNIIEVKEKGIGKMDNLGKKLILESVYPAHK
jgi:hypothetical protein